MDTTDGADLPDLTDDAIAAVALGGVLQPTPPDAPSLQVGGQQAAPTAPPKHETEAEARVRESKAAAAERIRTIRESAMSRADRIAIRAVASTSAGHNDVIQAIA